VLTAIT